jgi:hypothetical protein
VAFICLAASDAGVPIEDVSRLVGHGSTSVTELATGIRSFPSSRVARRSWMGYSVRRPDRHAAKAFAGANGVESQAKPR